MEFCTRLQQQKNTDKTSNEFPIFTNGMHNGLDLENTSVDLTVSNQCYSTVTAWDNYDAI